MEEGTGLFINKAERIATEQVGESMDAAMDAAYEGTFCSAEMVRLCEIAKIVARTDVPVLLTGESGVGKDVLARFIHRHSQRAKETLIRVNCAALPHDLLESELFGYERGAFTGAMGEKPGKFELADGGTIFLDEIAEMSPQLQAKLLHVLQDGEYCRLGGKHQLRVDTRVLASTNRRLEEAVSRGEFRDDLYFRLNVIRIKIPPLRERKQEILLLSNYFVEKYRERYGSSVRRLPGEILQGFMDYDWPGNIRELENVIKRYLILPNMDIEMAGLSFQRSKSAATTEKGVEVQHQNNPALPTLPAKFSSLKQAGLHAAEQAEREIVQSMLRETNWNRKQAARRLNICYKALLNKIKKWQIHPPAVPITETLRPKRANLAQSNPEADLMHNVQPV